MAPNKRYLISVEGNIGSGKTTLLKKLNEIYPYPVFFEPVDEWKFLEDFYKDQKKYAFIFQLEVLFSYRSLYKQKGFLFSERSIASGFLIFATLLRDKKILSSNHFEQLQWIWEKYNEFPDLVIYIDTDPISCLERIQNRNRICEQTIDLEYLIELDIYHKKFLHYLKTEDIQVLIINGLQSENDILTEIQKKFLTLSIFSKK